MRREGERLLLEGPVTLAVAAGMLVESEAFLADGITVVDFYGVTTTDSAALALAVEWMRRSAASNRALKLSNLPESMRNMAKLYAVTELLQ